LERTSLKRHGQQKHFFVQRLGTKVTATVPRRSASEVSKIRCTSNSNRDPVVGAYSKPSANNLFTSHVIIIYFLINVYSAPEKQDSVTQLSDIDPMRG
jgi:hypothetical protein